MNRKRIIYFTDLMLVPLFILVLHTGIKLHIAGHGTDHDIWHYRAVFHIITSLLFTIFGVMHVKHHWGWYKGLKTKGIKGKSKIILLLSFILIPVIVTGVWLLCIEGANSSIGILHYQVGLMAGVLGILHILKRWRFLVPRKKAVKLRSYKI